MEILQYLLKTIADKIFNFDDQSTLKAVEGMYNKAETVLKEDSIAMTVAAAFVSVGICICVIYWLVHLLKTLNYKDITPEWIIRTLIRLLVGFVLISNFTLFIPKMNEFANLLTTEIQQGFSDNKIFTNDSDKLSTILESKYGTKTAMEKNKDYLNAKVKEPTAEDKKDDKKDDNTELTYDTSSKTRILQSLLELFAYQLLLKWFSIFILINSISRAINIARKCIYAPFALANVFGEGEQNQSFRYLRELFALFMQQPIVYLITAIGLYILAIKGVGTITFFIVVCSISGLIMKSKSISESIFV